MNRVSTFAAVTDAVAAAAAAQPAAVAVVVMEVYRFVAAALAAAEWVIVEQIPVEPAKAESPVHGLENGEEAAVEGDALASVEPLTRNDALLC